MSRSLKTFVPITLVVFSTAVFFPGRGSARHGVFLDPDTANMHPFRFDRLVRDFARRRFRLTLEIVMAGTYPQSQLPFIR